MKHLTILLTTILLGLSSVTMAQEDDMYFTSKKDKKEKQTKSQTPVTTVEVIYEDYAPATPVTPRVTATVPASTVRDVDEYNRRGRYVPAADTLSADTMTAYTQPLSESVTQPVKYELSAQSLYDLG